MANIPTAAPRLNSGPTLTKAEFQWIKNYLHKQSGILLNESKQAMVMGRLSKRLRYYDIDNYMDYFQLFGKPGYEDETFMAIDLLTTNETYFFREPKHFEFIKNNLIMTQSASQPIRIWSAASSSGEEAYTLAMMLAEYAKSQQWEIIGTDISLKILAKARRGLYPISATEKIPQTLLKKYCLRGTEEYKDFFVINPVLRNQVKFLHANLISNLPELGIFDVIFLRNVMIYFDMNTKQKLVERLQSYLRPGGYFIIRHSESLSGMNINLKMVSPSIYRKSGNE